MCNYLDNGQKIKAIPKEGIGYKVMIPDPHTASILWFPFKSGYISVGLECEWGERPSKGDGFTFFRNVKSARKLAKRVVGGYKVIRIKYEQGLGERYEPSHPIEAPVALAKVITLVEEVPLTGPIHRRRKH